MKHISRREFLKYIGAGTLGIITKPKFPLTEQAGGRASDVIQCFDENATTGSTINESIVQIMMDESIKTLTSISDIGEAWKSVFPGITVNSIISIKVNCINSAVPTNPEFVNCIANGLAQMNFSGQYYQRNNIIIWDRYDSELSSSGYTIYTGTDPDTVRCFGTNHAGVGYDGSCPLDVPGGPVYPSRIMSLMSDYLINAGVLKNHSASQGQITLTLKNHYGSVSPVPSHGGYCTPGIPAVNQQIRDVITPNDMQKIFIVDSLWGNVLSGPGGNPNCNPKKLLMSLDTVACDYRGWQVINEERQGLGYQPISWPIHHIQTAEQNPYNLGTTDINLIEINNPSTIEESKTLRPVNGIIEVSPNPFRERTTIALSLTHPARVHLDIVNLAGRIVARVYSGDLPSGNHTIPYEHHTTLAAGRYFLRLYSQGTTRITNITILK